MRILDTDHCVAILRGRLDLTDHVLPSDELAVTAINVSELAHGAHKSRHVAENLARLDVLLATVTILAFDEAAARRCGLLKARLETTGERLADLDLQIASIAIEWHALLVTHNQKHFDRLIRSDGLLLEDWLK